MSKKVSLLLILFCLFLEIGGVRAERGKVDLKEGAACFDYSMLDSLREKKSDSIVLQNISEIGGIRRNSLVFSGKNSFIRINKFKITRQNGITISAWVKLKSVFTDDYRYIIGKQGWPTPYALLAEWSSHNPVSFTICSEGKRHSLSGGRLDDLEWHYIAGTYDQREGRMVLYFDGVEVASGFKGHFPIKDEVLKPLIIGGASGNHCFPGLIDECYIYDYALSPKEIQGKYNLINKTFLKSELSAKNEIFKEQLELMGKKLAGIKRTSTLDKYYHKYIQGRILRLQKILKSGLLIKGHQYSVQKIQERMNGISQLIDAFVSKNLVNEKIITYVLENPINNKQIFPDSVAIPGEISNQIRVVVTPGEYESASFVISAIQNVCDLEFAIGDLKSRDGDSISASNIDLKVVKCWYQSGSSSGSTPVDEGENLLTPELLLNDDSIVKVDSIKKKNYLRYYDRQNRKNCYVDVSKPSGVSNADIENLNIYFADSDKLMPVSIKGGTNKQFWITILAPAKAKPGIYSGKLKLITENKLLDEIKIKVRILPFVLSKLSTRYNSKKEFTSSMYYWGELADDNIGDMAGRVRSEKQFRAELKSMLKHGITNPLMLWSSRLLFRNEKLFRKFLGMREELGIKGPLYISEGRDIISAADKAGIKRFQQNVKKVIRIAKEYGIDDVYFYGIDEATGEVLKNQRSVWKAIRKVGGKVFVSGYIGSNFKELGDIQDLLICAGPPSISEAEKWHKNNHKIFCYANPQGGMEAPETYRKNYGILLWKANYDGACTFCYMDCWHGFPWNDFSSSLAPPNRHRPHCMAYPTSNGVVETLQLEGYREGIDDIRYVCTLRDFIQKAKNSDNAEIVKRANVAEKCLENIDISKKLGLIRLEIIMHILELQGAQGHSQGIVGAWDFNEGHGEVAKDSSGHNHEAIVVGAGWKKNSSGYELLFDGKGNYLEIPDSESFNFGSNDFTISFWIKCNPKVDPGLPDIISKWCYQYRGVRPVKGYKINLRSDAENNKLLFAVGNGTSSGVAAVSSRGIKDGKWHYIVCSRNKEKLVIYIDGKLDATVQGKNMSASSDEHLFVGHESFSPLGVRHFAGSLDAIKIFGYALSSNAVMENYKKNKTKFVDKVEVE